MNESKKLLSFGVELLNVGSKLINKKGIFVVFQLSDEAMALGTFNMDAFKAEWKTDVKTAVNELVTLAKSKLDIENKDLQAKLSGAFDLIEKGVGLVEDDLLFISEVKALF